MAYNLEENGVDMNSSNEITHEFSSPERIPTKLTPRALVYDDIDGDIDETTPQLGLIRRRTHVPFTKNNNNNNSNHNNNNNDEADKSSMDEDDDTSKFLLYFLFCLYKCVAFLNNI